MLESDDFPRSSLIYDSINPIAEQQNDDDYDEGHQAPDLEEHFSDNEEQPRKKRKHNPRDKLIKEKCVFKLPILPEEEAEGTGSIIR